MLCIHSIIIWTFLLQAAPAEPSLVNKPSPSPVVTSAASAVPVLDSGPSNTHTASVVTDLESQLQSALGDKQKFRAVSVSTM